jgi:hypothetical protein
MLTDREVEKELTEAGVEPIRHKHLVEHSEVPTHYRGFLATKLGSFHFYRNWYYWVAEGDVPLTLAEKMYADPVGKKDVRCGGHCGCPPPASEATRYLGRQPILATKEREAVLDMMPDKVGEYHYSDNPNVGTAYVTAYHIDSQEGLNLFVRSLKEGV